LRGKYGEEYELTNWDSVDAQVIRRRRNRDNIKNSESKISDLQKFEPGTSGQYM